MDRRSEGRRESIPIATQPTHRSRFLRACHRQPVSRTPVWFLRQAERYQSWYMEIRKRHSLLEIRRSPQPAAEVTITAAQQLGVDAAIIFSDLLLPLTPMGLEFGHGIVPETWVEKVIDSVKWVKEYLSNKGNNSVKGLEYVQSGFDVRSETSDQ
jgi:uroporphyrinogen decarboxylase